MGQLECTLVSERETSSSKPVSIAENKFPWSWYEFQIAFQNKKFRFSTLINAAMDTSDKKPLSEICKCRKIFVVRNEKSLLSVFERWMNY